MPPFQNGITNVELSYPLTDELGNLRVLFAGEATDASYYGTVHGAMISAGVNVITIRKTIICKKANTFYLLIEIWSSLIETL